MTPTFGPNGARPFLNTDTAVPKPRPSFIYTHPGAHGLGQLDTSLGKEG